MNHEKPSLTRDEKWQRRGKPTLALVGGLAVGAAAGAGITAAAYNHISADKELNNCQPGEETITVEEGDTLWDIAKEANPEADPRDEMIRLQQANPEMAEPDYIPQPGDTISIPVCLPEKAD